MLVRQIISKAKYDYRSKGLKYVLDFYFFNLACNLLKYPYYKYIHNKETFEFKGGDCRYFCHWYNNTFNNERYVEIPVVCSYIRENRGKEILEVGNVMSHYFDFSHDIVDKFEKDREVINSDIVDYRTEKRYDLIFSISTMEHVGWDERPKDPEKVIRALENMRSLLKSEGRIVVTIPKGYNPELDRIIDQGRLFFDETYCFKRVSRDNRWIPVDWSNIRDIVWEEKYPYANALYVGVFNNKK